MNRLLLAVLLAWSLVAPAGAQVIKIATLAPDGSGWMRELRAAAAEVKAGTAGRVEVKFYPGGVMGGDAVVLRKMRLGQLQGGVLTSSELSLVYPDAPLYSLPFLFKDWSEVDRVRAQVDPLLAKGFEQRGMRRRNAVAEARFVQRDDPCGGHRAKPFADVALVEASAVGEFLAGRRTLLDRFEQAGAVSDRDHKRGRRAIEDSEQPAAEFLLGGAKPAGLVFDVGEHRTGVAHDFILCLR